MLRYDGTYPQQGIRLFAMRAFKSSSSKEFELGSRAGQEAERALIARKLHKGFECLTAASFAIELAKKPDDQQTELVSRASKLLAEAIELLREVLDGQRDKDLRTQPKPEHPPGQPVADPNRTSR